MGRLTTKPPLGAQLDFSQSICKGLYLFWPLLGFGSGVLEDVSGSNKTGTVNGATWVPGDDGGVLSFDGTNDTVDLLGYLPWPLGGWVTFSFWYRIEAAQNAKRVVSFQGWGGTYDSAHIALDAGFGTAIVGYRNGSGGDIHQAQNTFKVWHHVVAIYNINASGTPLETYGYEDGKPMLLTSMSLWARDDGGSYAIRLGTRFSLATYFAGQLDLFGVWFRALTYQEILQLYLEPYSMFKRRPVWMGYSPGGEPLTKSIGDTITLSDALTQAFRMSRGDTLTLSDAVARAVGLVRGDTLTLSDAVVKRPSLIKADSLTLSDSMMAIITLILALADTVTLSDSVARSVGMARADTITLTDSATKGVSSTRADTITLTDVLARAAYLSRSDTVTLSDAMTRAAHLSQADVMSLADSLTKSSQISLADILSLADVFSYSMGAISLDLSDTVTLTDFISLVILALELGDTIDAREFTDIAAKRSFTDTADAREFTDTAPKSRLH